MKWLSKASAFILFLLIGTLANAASYWEDIEGFSLRADQPLMAKASKARSLRVNIDAFKQQLLNSDNVDVELPLPNGQTAVYHFEFSPVAEQGLLDKFPNIRTFKGVDVSDDRNRGRFDISPAGFRAMFHHNDETVMIDPLNVGNNQRYISYYAKHAQSLSPKPVDDVFYHGLLKSADNIVKKSFAKGSSDRNIRTYRLAVATTGEYTAFFSEDTDPIATRRSLALAAVFTAINRINQIFEAEVGIRLNLVANNDQIIYVDSTTDTYANDGSISDLSRNQINIDTVIGSANYDIGHLFGTGAGGIAALGSVCDDSRKARGLTGLSNPTGDVFYIDFVSHEIGHQFGANHTFNGTSGSCGLDSRNASTAYEPGSGSTIMAYSGICGQENLPDLPSDNNDAKSDPYFHAGSIAEMTRFITTGQVGIEGTLLSGSGNTCGVVSANVNNVPNAVAGPDVTIPANTPIYLTGTATDIDGDALTYVWEQFDLGAESTSVAEWVDNGDRPLFRSIPPTINEFRYLPSLANLVDSDVDNGESIPSTNRNLNFRFTVRDNNGATAFENKVVAVTTAAGPFDVLTPEDDDVWTQGTTIVTWDVANTDVSPVNCPSVDIFYDNNLFDSDDVTDNSFSTELAIGVPNDGAQLVTTPVGPTLNARVMVRCSNNAFFSISDSPFEVSSSSSSIVSSVSNVNAIEGNAINFSIVMSAEPSASQVVNFEISTGTASVSDFGEVSFSSGVINNNNGTLTVPPGVVLFTAAVPTNDDNVSESDETFVLAVGSASGVATILDNDSGDNGGDGSGPGSGSESGGNVADNYGEGSSGGALGAGFIFLLLVLMMASRRKQSFL